MNNPQTRQGGHPQGSPKQSSQHQLNNQSHQQQQQQQAPDENKITPELLVDALSGHEDGLLSIAERLMTHYDSGYDAMGEAIIDAFADVQKLFQHVVEAAHMEGAALERERGEGEWRRRMESLGMDVEGVLYGQINDTLDGTMMTGMGSPSRDKDHSGGEESNDRNDATANHLTPSKSEEHHRHEELIDQDVRDVLIDAIKRGQSHRDAARHSECRALYETACGSASALLPVDSDHRGRLQLAVARAESMSADRACAILKYAMDDVLRSGLSLRQGRYPQMDIKERSDCVLSRPNPLRSTPSRGYDVSGSWDNSNNYNSSSIVGSGDTSTCMVEQSAEEALNSLVEEMKEILAAPVYNLTPLQTVSEKFWLAMGEAKKASVKKEERLEQALAKIKADFLLAREEYEEQLSEERERVESMKRRFNGMRNDRDGGHGGSSQHRSEGEDALHEPYAPSRPHSAASRGSSDGDRANLHRSSNIHYNFGGMDDNSHSSNRYATRGKNSSSQSVVSLGSEFAQKAKSLVHLLNCQGGKEPVPGTTARSGEEGSAKTSPMGRQGEDLNYGRGLGGSLR